MKQYDVNCKIRNGKRRIAIDLDGTICPTKNESESYKDIIPYKDAVNTIKELKKQGHTILIFTARHQISNKFNNGKIIANLSYLYDWLKKWGIPYDEIWFKPSADIYIDDRAIQHVNWNNTKTILEIECKKRPPLFLKL